MPLKQLHKKTLIGQTYKEFKPPFPLAAGVECVWELRSDLYLDEYFNRILPDGCVDVIFNLADLPNRVADGFPRLRSYVVGTMRKSVGVWQAGKVDLLGIRFRPGGALPFLQVSAAEITDSVIALEDILGDTARATEARLAELNFAGRVKLLEKLLQPSSERESSGARIIKQASMLIAQSNGAISARELHLRLAITPRQLERLFIQYVGLSPKLACRITRFQNAVKTLRREANVNWVDLALFCGYYDQAHFIRDFREFAGITPTAFRAEQENVAFVQSEKASTLLS